MTRTGRVIHQSNMPSQVLITFRSPALFSVSPMHPSFCCASNTVRRYSAAPVCKSSVQYIELRLNELILLLGSGRVGFSPVTLFSVVNAD